MARLHADENFDYRVVQELRRLGHDVLTAHEAGRANQGIGNGDVLTFAVSQKRAVLTFNRADFIRLHKHKQLRLLLLLVLLLLLFLDKWRLEGRRRVGVRARVGVRVRLRTNRRGRI
jgi:hypothetical protein